MKILFSLLAFCLFASCVHSQEAVDTVSVRVQYRVKYNERNMKLRDKDTKKYLLTVFVATFVAYIIPAVVLYLGYFMGIMLTICISLFNLSMALLAWLWAKSVRKEFSLKMPTFVGEFNFIIKIIFFESPDPINNLCCRRDYFRCKDI